MIVICIKQHLSNIWSLIHEKVKQHCEWVEKNVAYKKKRTVLNYRFSYFWSFTHDITTQNTTHSNICIFIAAIPQVSLGKGQGVDEKSSKKT